MSRNGEGAVFSGWSVAPQLNETSGKTMSKLIAISFAATTLLGSASAVLAQNAKNDAPAARHHVVYASDSAVHAQNQHGGTCFVATKSTEGQGDDSRGLGYVGACGEPGSTLSK
jgi:hypothetical protein